MNNNLTRRKFFESDLNVVGISMLPIRYGTIVEEKIDTVDNTQDRDAQNHEMQLRKWYHKKFWLDIYNREPDEAMSIFHAILSAYLVPSPSVLTRGAWGKYTDANTRTFLHNAVPELELANARAVASLIRFLEEDK